MTSRHRWTWLAVIPLLALSACGPNALEADGPELALRQQAEEEEGPKPTAVSNKVLILSTSVFSGSSSQEATAARNLGMSVDVFLPSQWAMLTAAEFAAYRAIILGDAKCVSLSAINAALANKNIWGPMVNGNIIVVGASPTFSTGTLTSPGPMTKDAIAFAIAQPNKTGAYISLSCYYTSPASAPAVPPGIAAQVLDQFGSFTVLSPSGCYNTAHIAGTFLTTPTITDTNLSNWGCSAREVFDSYPEANFAPLVIAKDNATGSPFPGSKTMPDGTHGPVYVIAKGAKPLNCGNGVVNATEECDNGALNGTFGNACSLTCRLHWCGDGIADPAEQCDLGADNGNTGVCSASCMTISTNRPPVARCLPAQSLTTPANSCGVSLSINNGSFDPDGNLLSCTQSPAGPYGLGTTNVTLTCRDTGGLASTCTTSVTVTDNVPPQLTCPTVPPVECTSGAGHTTLPAPTTAIDNCSAVTVTGPGERDFALGTTPVTYTATDRANNSAQCTTDVVVADTLGPVVIPNGFGRIQLECGIGTYNELGATANDQCYGDVSSTVTVSGSVDPSTRGSYMITYRATDPEGHVGEGYRDVVVEDLTPPALSLVGANPQPLECGIDSYTELGVTAQDSCSGDLTPFIHIDASGVDPNAVGPYSVRYWVSDAREWSAETTRSVSVTDNTPPVISLHGNPTPVLECGVDSYVEEGATATDACSGDLSDAITITNPVDSGTKGDYSVHYSVEDPTHHGASADRVVTVADTRRPNLTLLGDASLRLRCSSAAPPWTDPGATATDACDGELTSQIVKTGTVNTGNPGQYPIVYSVTDGAGLTETQTRTVEVFRDPPQLVNRPVTQLARSHTMASLRLSDCATLVVTCGNPMDINQVGHIVSIYSDEPDDSRGDGHTVHDIVLDGQSSFRLRAERAGGGNGRAYGVTFYVLDPSDGTRSEGFCKFVVPHDHSARPVIDDGPAAGHIVYAP